MCRGTAHIHGLSFMIQWSEGFHIVVENSFGSFSFCTIFHSQPPCWSKILLKWNGSIFIMLYVPVRVLTQMEESHQRHLTNLLSHQRAGWWVIKRNIMVVLWLLESMSEIPQIFWFCYTVTHSLGIFLPRAGKLISMLQSFQWWKMDLSRHPTRWKFVMLKNTLFIRFILTASNSSSTCLWSLPMSATKCAGRCPVAAPLPASNSFWPSFFCAGWWPGWPSFQRWCRRSSTWGPPSNRHSSKGSSALMGVTGQLAWLLHSFPYPKITQYLLIWGSCLNRCLGPFSLSHLCLLLHADSQWCQWPVWLPAYWYRIFLCIGQAMDSYTWRLGARIYSTSTAPPNKSWSIHCGGGECHDCFTKVEEGKPRSCLGVFTWPPYACTPRFALK